ncbi:MAG: hypothetical protein COB12_03320 [Flavobacterium sp.]|nr:MAG: hypothetical protein COB12_03320 [Flavobacterium sp.]
MKYLLVLFTTLFFISCKNSSEEISVLQEKLKTDDFLYGNKNYIFSALSENAKIEVMSWGAFEDFETQAKSINGNTIESIKEKSKQMVSLLDSIAKKIPDTLYTNAIQSRVVVAKTRSKLLKQEVNKAHIDSARLQKYINEMNISVNNLIIQINEKFQKDAIDFQRIDNEKQELENQKRFLDSVYKAELQDQKNKR